MGVGPLRLKTVLLASILVVVAPLAAAPQAQAATHEHHPSVAHAAAIHHGYVHREPVHHPYVKRVAVHRYLRPAMAHHVAYRSEPAHKVVIRHAVARRFGPVRRWVARGISCVPFARSDSGIDLAGNAWQWWDHAAGVYARGSLPEPGSVLAFRSNPHMRLGHVAVVSRIVNRREIEIDQANWGPGMRGSVSRDVPVVDVSEANDWTAVRVGLGASDRFGSVYPTYGFIYDRPDNGTLVATISAPAPQPHLNPAPSDLRPAVERPWKTYEEVAEAPDSSIARKPVLRPVTPNGGLVGAIDRK